MRACSPTHYHNCKTILQSSFDDLRDLSADNTILGSKNGFIHAAINAYSAHHHLLIRPEDIWFSILTQLSFYINAHAEDLRSFFVSHRDRKKLEVLTFGDKHTVDFGQIAQHMTSLMETHLNGPELLPWIMPDFTTTTEDDEVVASILMTGAMQKYFFHGVRLSCGLPSVTLLGEREDWEKILARLGKINQLGAEAVQFATLLKPILVNFIASFDTPGDRKVVHFWNKIAHKTGGSDTPILSGWITAFCFWDLDGKSLYAPEGKAPKGKMRLEQRDFRSPGCELDGTLYPRLSIDHIPVGFASVPVEVDDNGKRFHAIMLAGSVGKQVTSSGEMLDDGRGSRRPFGRPDLDSLQPLTGWWMYER